MKQTNFFYLSITLFYFLVGCGGNTSPIYPLDTDTLPTGQRPSLPSTPRSSNQTPTEYFLEQFFQFCETKNKNPYYPFCLTLDFRNIRSILSPKIQSWKNLTTTEFINTFNRWAANYSGLSHLYLKENSHFKEAYFKIHHSPRLSNKITYLKVEDFENNYLQDFVYHIIQEANYNRKIIINLWNNNGGHEKHLKDLLSFFLPTATSYGHLITREHLNYLTASDYQKDWMNISIQNIVQRLNPYWSTQTIPKHNRFYFKGKIAILVNDRSFSSAEIFAYVLKNFRKGDVKLFGSSTKGKVQQAISIPVPILNSELTYPIGELFTLEGGTLENIGVSVDEPAYGEKDALEKAEEWITEK